MSKSIMSSLTNKFIFVLLTLIFTFTFNSKVLASDQGMAIYDRNIFATKYIRKNQFASDTDNQIYDLLYSKDYINEYNNLMNYAKNYKYYYIGWDTIYFWNDKDIKLFAITDNVSFNSFPQQTVFRFKNINKDIKYFAYKMSVSDAINGNFDNVKLMVFNPNETIPASTPYFMMKSSYSMPRSTVSMKILDENEEYYSFIGWHTNYYITYYLPDDIDAGGFNYFSKLKIMDTIYYNNSIIYSPTNSYSNDIDCSDKSKIIVEFDAPLDEDYLFDFNFKIKTDKSSNLPTPTMRSDKDSNIHIEEIMNKIETDNGYEYSGKFGLDVVKNNKFKFVIDVKNYKNILNLYFETNLNYEVSYVYDKDDDNHYQTINMKDIYGLYLMPKTLSNENMQAIYLKGRYDIEFRKNYTDNGYDVEDKFTDYSYEVLEVKSLGNEYNNLIYFVNLDYSNGDDDYYIKFDTRYYNYTIKEYAYSSPEIENPNTGDVIQLPEMDVIGPGAENSLSDYLNSARNFIQSISIYIREYMGVISYLFTSLPPMVKSGIITLFIIFVICCLIKVGRG